MQRGEIWTQSGGPGYAGKPRPVLIVQSDLLLVTDSIITCPFTSHGGGPIPTRLSFVPTPENGLREPCDLMVEKLGAVAKSKLGRRIGAVTPSDMEQAEEAMLIVLGFVR